MTAKEKAKELIIKFRYQEKYTLNIEVAKQCALICVDEIISACEYNLVETHNSVWWNKVKEEINKL